METSQLLTADTLDILFDGRNKAYGAYDLRRNYSRRMMIALLSLLSLIVLGMAIAQMGKGNTSEPQVMVNVLSFSKVKMPEKKTEPKKVEKKDLPQPHSMAAAPKGKKSAEKPIKLATARYTPPKIVEDPDQSKKLASMKELLDKKIATFTQEGLKTDLNAGATLQTDDPDGAGFGVGTDGPGSIAGGKGTGTGSGNENFNPGIQQEAAYDGNWSRFVEMNLRRDLPGENGAPTANYTVRVQFTVAKDGSISNIKALNDPGYGTADEACRAIRMSKKWKPAMQNGRPVETKKIQSITFQVTE